MGDQGNWTSLGSEALIQWADSEAKSRGDDELGLNDAGGLLASLTVQKKANSQSTSGTNVRQQGDPEADGVIQEALSILSHKSNGTADEAVGKALMEVCRGLSLEYCALVQRQEQKTDQWSTAFSWTGVEETCGREFAPEEELSEVFGKLEQGQVLRIGGPGVAKRPGQPWSGIILPLGVGPRVSGALVFGTLTYRRAWDFAVELKLQIVADFVSNLLARRQAEVEVRALQAKVELLSQTDDGGVQVRDNVRIDQQYANIIGKSPAINGVIAQAEQVAGTESIVLLTGETGTGKELVAQLIHDLSPRRGRPMVKVNCAALPPNLVESELFGRERGAYTGAMTREIGRFELANHSTIFLDELAELPLELQAKLLRVLQDGEFERVGSPKAIRVNARVIAATNRDLKKAMSEGKFREDLYYRLNVFPIEVPPLRERPEDIPMLVWAFVGEFGNAMGKTIEAIPQAGMEALQRYAWPGNVRELRNVIERAMIVSNGPTLRVVVPSCAGLAQDKGTLLSLRDLERQHILEVMRQTRWRVRGVGGAAELLGLKPTTLEARMAKLGISRNSETSAEGANSKSPLASGAEN